MDKLILLFIILTLAGCGTVKGMGQDISTVGGWFSNASDTARK